MRRWQLSLKPTSQEVSTQALGLIWQGSEITLRYVQMRNNNKIQIYILSWLRNETTI